MRNWPATLRPASYKGTAFFVDEESLPKSGRFVARHTFVKSGTHSTEDMGRVPREFRVAAYFASDAADTDMQAFVELCSEAGAGSLVLPMFKPADVRCTNCHVKSKSRDKQGYIEVELDFVEAGTADGGGFPAKPLGDRLASAALAQLPTAALSVVGTLDTVLRQDSVTRRLDPLSAANADRALPASTDYQGSKSIHAASEDAFNRLFR